MDPQPVRVVECEGNSLCRNKPIGTFEHPVAGPLELCASCADRYSREAQRGNGW